MKHKTIIILFSFLILSSLYADGPGDDWKTHFNQGVKNTDFLSQLEIEVWVELNIIRENPAGFIPYLEEQLGYFKRGSIIIQRPGEIGLRTKEGRSAFEEAINFLKKQKPVGMMKISRGMSFAAKDHVREQGPSGRTGHYSQNGNSPFDRMNKYGKWQNTAGENIDYGNNKAKRILMALIVDDGVPSRGHRTNIFNPDFKIVGIACGSHKNYRHMCVMTYAGGYREAKSD